MRKIDPAVSCAQILLVQLPGRGASGFPRMWPATVLEISKDTEMPSVNLRLVRVCRKPVFFRFYWGMSRRLRYVPVGGALVEVTCRTIHSRFLLRPGELVNQIVVGVLGRAQRMYQMRVCGYILASNHLHLALDVEDAGQLCRFMRYVNSNLARKVGRLVGWRDKIWSRRYQAIVISPEEAAQAERLRYIVSHGVKENLVERVEQWPGVHCAKSLLSGEPAVGYWFDQTKEYAARRR